MSAVVQATPIPMAPASLPAADPCVVVIFGASGDLTQRKLVPALYRLACAGCLSGRFQVLGIGRTPMDDAEFRARMRAGSASSQEMSEINDAVWQAFASRLHYKDGCLDETVTYLQIARCLEQMHIEEGASTNHLFYAATPPSLAPSIVDGLGAAGLAAENAGWSRLIIEKPFGRDLASARELNAYIARVFDEHQVYRIDHYLGKETVQNLLVFRFGNSLFEPVWNRNFIDYIEITAAETLGVENRAGYYEEAGALRDMVANHLLQLLTMIAMEPPVAFDADAVREEKVKVLRAIPPMVAGEVAERTVRGQYGPGEIDGRPVPGYREEPGVAKDSMTETYAAAEFHIENWRWAEVPFYLRTGKRLAHSVTEIAVHFKRTPQTLFAQTPDDRLEPNTIVLRIQPDEGIVVTFGAKRPGVEMHTGTVHMDFCYRTAFGVRSPGAYETLLLDAMRGNATLFTRRDEVEAQWRLITPIEEAWAHQPPTDFPNYAAGAQGPEEADKLLERSGKHWRDLDANFCR
jgi:glucose-6-phosphate 1-dehydrogenase